MELKHQKGDTCRANRSWDRMVSLSQVVREGFSEEEVFKGAIGEAEEAATAAWGGENFKQRESRSTALRQETPLSPGSISPGPGPGKGQVGPGHPFLWLCLLRGRVPGADRKLPGKPICAVARLQ